MGFRNVLVTAAVILVVLTSLSVAQKGNPTKGKEVFSRCAVCHGNSGEGREAIAKVYGVEMRRLGSKAVQSEDDASLKKGIVEGKGKMPPVKLTDQELADVVAFLRTLKE